MARHSQGSQYHFLLSAEQIEAIASDFRQAMVNGLLGAASPLKMLPSFLDIPKGEIEGTYLAVDFGGSHIRALEVGLKSGQAQIAAYRKIKLPEAKSAAELFRCIALLVKAVALSARYLGHTFSFPCRQQDLNTAHLIAWTKEIATPGVEGENINHLLEQALRQQGVAVQPVAILNDTVGTLLTAAYSYPGADIASICGTGHNTCYLEPAAPRQGKPMIINMESGNFNKLPFTRFDKALDAESERPGQQRLEKMVAGRYLGELARLAIMDLIGQGSLPDTVGIFHVPYSLSAEDIAGWVEAGPLSTWLKAQGIVPWTDAQCSLVTNICQHILLRSAQLAAATFLGVLLHIDPALERKHVIGIDGSLYEKAPGYAAQLEFVLGEALGDKGSSVEVKLVKDGSGIGAAIAAAVASKEDGYNGSHTDETW